MAYYRKWKTLTSFKTSTLLKDNPEIEKCLFVVDRKDLDRQTRLEFNKFQEGRVEENTNTESLVKRLTSDDYRDKVIVTTIQKLGLALNEDSKRNQEKRKGANRPTKTAWHSSPINVLPLFLTNAIAHSLAIIMKQLKTFPESTAFRLYRNTNI